MNQMALVCEGLNAGWGDTQVLSNLTFALPRGEVLAVLGRNGVGKSTLLSTVMGRATCRSGSISFQGRAIARLPVFDRAKLGIGFVPQEREIFPSLSVKENLLVATSNAKKGAHLQGRTQPQAWTLERVLDLFPRLGERLNNGGNQLSGGEQQMLSIGRALMGGPSLLMLDEPMEGLAPVIIEQLVAALHRLQAESDMAILLVEQHVALALEFTKRVIVLDRGEIIYDNASGDKPVSHDHISSLTGVGNG